MQWNKLFIIKYCFNKFYNFHQYNINADENKNDPCINNKNVNNDSIHTACYLASQGELEQLQFMYLQHFDLNKADYDGRTPLHLACCENKLEIVKFLIEKCGCDINIKDRWGNTPLDDAIREGHNNIQYYLKN